MSRSQKSEVRSQQKTVPMAKTFQDLIVWQKANTFVLQTHQLSQTFPENECYGLTAQLRRAAISIPANMAEGFRRQGRNDKVRFYNLAQGSLEECRYQLILSTDLEFNTSESIKPMLEEVSRLLDRYIKTLLNSDFLIFHERTPCPPSLKPRT
jgi:four helix bundle protein